LLAGLPVVGVVAALTVAGCTGGGSSSPTPAASVPVSGTNIISTGAGAVVAPQVAGLTATLFTGPGASPGTAITLTSSATAPANAVLPSSVRRAASIANAVPFLYVTFTVSQNLPASVMTGQSVSLNGQPAIATYFEEIDDTTTSPGTKFGTITGTLGNGLVTFDSSTVFSSSSAFIPGHDYTLMFYYTPGLATPTPTPSPTPTGGAPTPTPSPTASGATPTPTPTPTPAPTASAAVVPAGTPVDVAIPPAGIVTGTLQTGYFSVDTTMTLSSVAGLPTGIASPTTTGVVFFSVGIATSPAVTINNSACTMNCSADPLVINPGLNTISAANGPPARTFYIAECNATGCPVSPSDAVAIPLQGSSLVVGPHTFTDVNGFGPATTWFVFYYQ
jgi:hypothetical protein